MREIIEELFLLGWRAACFLRLNLPHLLLGTASSQMTYRVNMRDSEREPTDELSSARYFALNEMPIIVRESVHFPILLVSWKIDLLNLELVY